MANNEPYKELSDYPRQLLLNCLTLFYFYGEKKVITEVMNYITLHIVSYTEWFFRY